MFFHIHFCSKFKSKGPLKIRLKLVFFKLQGSLDTNFYYSSSAVTQKCKKVKVELVVYFFSKIRKFENL